MGGKSGPKTYVWKTFEVKETGLCAVSCLHFASSCSCRTFACWEQLRSSEKS